MRITITASLLLLGFASATCGQGFCITFDANGTIIFHGPLDDLAGIEALSPGGHLSFKTIDAGPLGAFPDVAPFPLNTGTVVDNTPNALVYGVLGAENRIDLAGSNNTGMRYSESIAVAWSDLSINFGLGNDPPVTVPFGSILCDRINPDCNGDGFILADDLECVTTTINRDAVLGDLNTLPGDLDGNGDVSFADFLVLAGNFGEQSMRYTDGNIDLEGGIDFADFLILSGNFNRVPTVAAVPEPESCFMIAIGFVGLFLQRRYR